MVASTRHDRGDGDGDPAGRRARGGGPVGAGRVRGGTDTREVQAALGGELAYTTVATILTRLCSKELAAQRVRDGATGTGSPSTSPDSSPGACASQLRYAHDTAGALGHFVSGLSSDEEAALRRVFHESDGLQVNAAVALPPSAA